MTEAHGISFSDRRGVAVFGPGTDDELVRHFHGVYKKSAHSSGFRQFLIKPERFRDLMDRGNIVVYVISEKGNAECVFGLQVMHDDAGDYLNFLFIYGFVERAIPLVVQSCFVTWYEHCRLKQLDQEGRLLIVGRKGWERILRKWQVEYVKERDGKYWIYEFARGRPN